MATMLSFRMIVRRLTRAVTMLPITVPQGLMILAMPVVAIHRQFAIRRAGAYLVTVCQAVNPTTPIPVSPHVRMKSVRTLVWLWGHRLTGRESFGPQNLHRRGA